MRPIWSQILQTEHTRLALVLEHLERIPGWVSGKHIVQAKVDAWHVSVSKQMAAEVEKLGALTIGQLSRKEAPMLDALGVVRSKVQCDEPAVRVSRVDLRTKVFRSEGVPSRRGRLSILAPPIIVGEDWDCLAAAKAAFRSCSRVRPEHARSWRPWLH